MSKSYLITLTQSELETIIFDCIDKAFKLNILSEKEAMPSNESDDNVKIDGAEQETKLKRGYIYQLVAENKIPHLKIGRSLRFSRKELRAWMKAGRPDLFQEIIDNMSSNHIVNGPKNAA